MKSAGDPATEALDRNRIGELLGLLNSRLSLRDISADIYVVGGAAIAMTVADRRVTRDVDVARLDARVSSEARAIAAAEGLPEAWLNASAAPWVPYSPAVASPDTTPGLVVRYAPPEHLLAMKMVALRQQDAPDIVVLAERLGLRAAAQFAAVLRSAYPGEGVLQQILGVPESQVDTEVDAIARRVARHLLQ